MAKRSAKPVAPRTSSRCAIYTRKSTEEGLDQEFNSLDAQREACAAYVLSQRHEGWTLLPEVYDDGGFSGGNMDRPGMRRLLAEVQARRVDVIVVYKVDRLTRSLADFAKIVEALDVTGASFVSITQAFNTTTSMGRLTLNVLLSFAQFEREVISERVRDKVAASKRKGMWMGGTVPLGYNVVARKLIPNEAEAVTVRHIMQRYLQLGTVTELRAALNQEGIRSKQNWANGKGRGGGVYGRGALYSLLANRLYRGETHHKGEYFKGEHPAIVDKELWDAVQRQLVENRIDRRIRVNARNGSLLAGRIHDGDGHPMQPSHACKGSVRYRYYCSAPGEYRPTGSKVERIAAGDLEPLIIAALGELLSYQPNLLSLVDCGGSTRAGPIVEAAKFLAIELPLMAQALQRQLFEDLDLQVQMEGEAAGASISIDGLARRLGAETGEVSGRRHQIAISTKVRRRSRELRIVVPAGAPSQPGNGRLVMLLGRAALAREQLFTGTATNEVLVDRELRRVVRFAFLAPDIVAAILEGWQPPSLAARQLARMPELPLDWAEQRRALGFARAHRRKPICGRGKASRRLTREFPGKSPLSSLRAHNLL